VRASIDFLEQVLTKWSADHCTTRGAALAYFTLFSLAPIVMLTIAMVGLVLGSAAAQGEIFARIQATVGGEAAHTIENLLANLASPASGVAATAVSLATMVIGASSAVAELQSSLNHIFEAPVAEGGAVRRVLRRRLAAVGLIVVIGVLLMASMLVDTVLNAAHRTMMGRFPIAAPVLTPLNFVMSLSVGIVLFSVVFRVLPDVTLRWHDALFGGAITATLFAVGKALLALYLGRAGLTSAYGAAGSVVLLLLWIYYSALIVLVGAEVTAVYARRREAAVATAASITVGNPDAR